jgi:hypothetical protein
MVLGNKFTALGRLLAPKPAYQQAFAIAKTMETGAEEIWVKTNPEKIVRQ